jgi:hypothetical protein
MVLRETKFDPVAKVNMLFRGLTDAQQARLLIEKHDELVDRQAFFLWQIQQHVWVERAEPAIHRQTIVGRKPHAAGDALTTDQGAHAGAAAEVGVDRPTMSCARLVLRQLAGNIFVG